MRRRRAGKGGGAAAAAEGSVVTVRVVALRDVEGWLKRKRGKG